MGARLAAWALIPATGFASDEGSYFQVATRLLTTGDPDLFWPPFTPWLIAAVRVLLDTDYLPAIRLAWIAMDIGCVLAVRALAIRVAERIAGGTSPATRRAAAAMTLGYALYLPAISHAQFLTSETPALLQLLLVLLLLTASPPSALAFLAGGALIGTLVMTRPSLLPLLAAFPLAIVTANRNPRILRPVVLFLIAGTLLVGALLARNWLRSGEITLSRNSAYNLYLGNRDMYGEDLNLLRPRATAAQIEFRRQMWSGELQSPQAPAPELQRQAIAWIIDHPTTFLRRSAGRLARVFVPKTDVIELVGGEQRVGVLSPRPLTLLALANMQWTVVLFGGLVGLAAIWRADRYLGSVFVATIAGTLVLCVVAISKPRYSFVFDPLLIIGAVVFLSAPRSTWAGLSRGVRRTLLGMFAFLIWGWIAWAIFAVTSRV